MVLTFFLEVDSLIVAEQFARHLPWTCRSENLIALADTLSNQTIDERGHFGCVSLRILFTCLSPLLHPFCQIFSLLLSFLILCTCLIFIYTLLDTGKTTDAPLMPRKKTMLRIDKKDSYKSLDSQENENRPSLELHNNDSYHDDRCSMELQIPSLFEHNIVSWTRIANDVDKFVTDPILVKKEDDIVRGKSIAERRPKLKPTVTWISVSIPVLEKKWIDIETKR